MQQITPLKLSLVCFGKPQDSLVSHLTLDQIKVHGENYKVCYYMIAMQGISRGSQDHRLVISELKGYGEMYIGVCSTFHSVFYSLEGERLIDPSNEIDVLVLQLSSPNFAFLNDGSRIDHSTVHA